MISELYRPLVRGHKKNPPVRRVGVGLVGDLALQKGDTDSDDDHQGFNHLKDQNVRQKLVHFLTPYFERLAKTGLRLGINLPWID